jgi:aminopeptidase N
VRGHGGHAHAFDRPSPAAAGIGDRLFPTLGNGGYDVQHYDLDLRYETRAPSQGIDGTVTILATATQSLSRFNLDWAGDSVGGVTVNGLKAKAVPDGEDLVITPKLPLLKGLPFIVQVSHYKAHPIQPDPNDLLGAPFFTTPDGSATAGQPAGTHTFLPSNDHPSDKATYTIRFDVPAGEPAFANGVLLSKSTSRGRTNYIYLMRQPMATELIQLAAAATQLFSIQVYYGGALVLYALRQKVGDATFQKIEREWVKRYRDESPSTADFIDLASKVARQDLHGFLHAWLYDTTTPPMPGHPDWVVAAPSSAAARTLATPPQLRFGAKR